MESRAHALAAGLFLVLMSIGCGFAIWYLSIDGEPGTEYLLVTTSAVGGLSPQAQVRYRGIRAGKVSDISIDPQNPREIRVRIDIPSRYPVTRATRAELSYLGVTGLALIDLKDDGSDPRPLQAGADGSSRIPLRGSQFDELGSQATDTMDVLRQVLLRLQVLLDERNVERISGTLANLQSATGRLDAALAEVPAMVAQAQQLFGRAQVLLAPQQIERLGRILDNVEQVSGEGVPLARDLRELLATMKQLSARLDSLASATGRQVNDETLPRLQQLLDEARSTSRQLGRVLGELEASPQVLLLGREPARPGPGEAGFDPTREGPGR
jgi:phospholipid/cholesterol/gamma-HCH transport system substrate-binding protein